MTKLHGFICGPAIYEYEGWLFEWPAYSIPWPLKKNLEPRKRAGSKFYAMADRFLTLSDKDKYACKVGGGCQKF